MLFKLFILVILQLEWIQCDGTISDSPFCNICTCVEATRDVHCKKEIAHDIFNTTAFWHKNENDSYPYRKVEIHKSGIKIVTEIPSSPLIILDLSNNEIQVIEVGSFRNLQKMQELILSNNELTNKVLTPETFNGLYHPGEYRPLESLKVLRLDGNIIHTLHQDLFMHMDKLETLDLHSNPLKYIDTQTLIALGSIVYLKNINLSYTQLTKIPTHFFHTPSNLQYVDLTGNDLTALPEALRDAMKLEWLSLDDNPIENITEQNGFPNLPKLKVLRLSYMPNLKTIGDHSMCKLSVLEELHLSQNYKLSHLSGKALSKTGESTDMLTWPPIKKLFLRNNQLSYLDHNLITNWEKLEDVDITDNPWTCECENQWLIDSFIKYMTKLNTTKTERLECGAPIEMAGKSMLELSMKNEVLRCLDKYDNRPERDASVLIGIFVGLFLGIPLVLGILFCYRKNWFGYFKTGPASFSRQYYNRTNNDDGDLN